MPKLPPRFTLTLPTILLFSPKIPPAAALAWLKLRCLAGEDGQTPELTHRQAAKLLGMSQSTLYKHLRLLRLYNLVEVTAVKGGGFSASFTENDRPPAVDEESSQAAVAEPQPSPDGPDAAIPDSENLESALDLNHEVNIDLRINELIEESASRFRETGNQPGEAAPQTEETQMELIYREVTKLRLKKLKRELLAQKELDPNLWRETLEHWMLHTWNPLNLSGILNLYHSGGPNGCRVCYPDANPEAYSAPPGSPPPSTAVLRKHKKSLDVRLRNSLQALNALRAGGEHGNPG